MNLEARMPIDIPIIYTGPMVRAIQAKTKRMTRRIMKRQPVADAAWAGGWRIDSKKISVSLEAFNARGGQSLTGDPTPCPYGQPGDRHWVRETWAPDPPCDGTWGYTAWAGCRIGQIAGVPEQFRHPRHCLYAASWDSELPIRWTPPIHMPRWASRITLEVQRVRVERLQDISAADAIAEGINELVPVANRGEGLTPGALCLAATMTVDAMPKLTRRAFLGGALAAALGFKASPSRPWEVQATPWTRAPSPQQVYALLWESINGPGSWDANPWVWVIEFKPFGAT